MVKSHDADTSRFESCEKATEQTPATWPVSTCKQSPHLASQIITVRSNEADASFVESCENTTDSIEPLWPLSICAQLPLLGFQILMHLSHDADASHTESCEKVTELLSSSIVSMQLPSMTSKTWTIECAIAHR